jgi:hypothetical protein
MLHVLSCRLLEKMESELEEIYYGEEELQQKKNLMLKKTAHTLGILNEHIHSKGFESLKQEIDYFRNILPSFYGLKLFYEEAYSLELRIPICGVKKLVGYYQREIEIIERFFQRHSFYYGYYKMGATDLDELFFLRHAKKESVLLMELIEVEGNCCTPVCYLFSKFKAFDQLLLTLKHRIAEQIQGNINFKSTAKSLDKLVWTGEAINLMELAYGIYHTKQLNNGSAGIGAICRWLGESLGVRVGIPSKRWSEIARRTSMSHTRFLDQMKKTILSKIEDDVMKKSSSK